MDKVTKTDVRKAFQAARELMRDIEKNLNTDDFEESGDLGQDIIYLIAECNIAEQYRTYKLATTGE